jgi:hypothetical protein
MRSLPESISSTVKVRGLFKLYAAPANINPERKRGFVALLSAVCPSPLERGWGEALSKNPCVAFIKLFSTNMIYLTAYNNS